MSKITKKKKEAKAAEHTKFMRRMFGENYGKLLCPSCHKMVQPEDMITDADPFASEIGKDHTIVTKCRSCFHESMMDI
jgi:hypothetical protein